MLIILENLRDIKMLIFSEKFNPTVLAISSHPDDVEIGAGGFICRLIKSCKANVHFAIMTYGVQQRYKEEKYPTDQRSHEAIEAGKILLNIKNDSIINHFHFAGYEDCKLEGLGHDLIKYIEALIVSLKPDIILTHAPNDLHADHRIVHHATLSAARDFHGTILFYYAPSTKPDSFKPSFFVELSEQEMEKKTLSLEAHISQREKDFMTSRTVERITEAWAAFHRMKEDTKLEAFELYKAFWK
jgi:LmbE family N-acetylglucosaminyl deacetylase